MAKNKKLTDLEFARHGREVIARYDAGELDVHEAGQKISQQVQVQANLHPMLEGVDAIAFDLAHDYYHGENIEQQRRDDWERLVRIISDYIEGNWYPTIWQLAATYGATADGKVIRGYSLDAKRHRGELKVRSGHDALKTHVGAVAKKINTDQTDQRFLQNLQLLLPPDVDDLFLMQSEVTEYLRS